jgi:hypothetical protein
MSSEGCHRLPYIGNGLGFPRSVDLESRSVTTKKAISTDYNRYPVMSRPGGRHCAASCILSCTPSLEVVTGVVISGSSGSTCRLGGRLVGQIHLSGTSVTLVGQSVGPLGTHVSQVVCI